ncbi:hypothetical protein [Rugamonas aquatica]|uniref:Curli production assembly/transport component CsgG n=1 Tax=Rugamonas aquatica TaxID=2743357 RepID=A0A6A7NAB8_9BURK|nr:hypothetical protein [Rugamonas aquatica]MQA42016.1 hypothetical protein [Rugamonas aquatica]
MNLNARILVAAFAGMLFHFAPARAQADARSYAVLSLIGNAIHVDTVRTSVGVRAPGETHHVLDIPDQGFDTTALLAANASIRRLQPGAKIVLMTTQDAELYKAQNTMFERPEANQANRDYLLDLLKDRGVSHLVLVTKQRDNAYFKLDNGSTGTGQLEGLGFYIDDTTMLRGTETAISSRGMLGPFAYVKARLLDARTLALVGEVKSNQSSIVVRPSSEASGMEIWDTMASPEKVDLINALLSDAVKGAMAPLLSK